MKSISTLLLIVLGTQLTGCALTMVAGSTAENEIVVTLDNGIIPDPARTNLRNAKVLGVISSDRSSIKAADLFETKGGYTVKIDRQAAAVGEMTGSERRDALKKLCSTQRPDVALLGRVVKTETGSFLATAFTGRAKASQAWQMEVLTCRTGAFDTFGGTLNMNIGVYKSNTPAQMEEAVGEQLGKTILAGIRGEPVAAATSSTDVAPAPVAAARPPPAAELPITAAPMSSSAPVAEMASPPMSVRDLQTLLAQLGYSVGTPDGVSGPRTVNAIRKFQTDNQLVVSGVADDATRKRLLNKASGK